MSIIAVEELSRRLDDQSTRIVDTRWYLGRPGAGRDAYRTGHIPGAVHLDLDADLSDVDGLGSPGRHPLPTPEMFRERMMRAGISTDSFVAAYDDAGGAIAARLWWMLDNLGHRGGVAVLDGGLPAWSAAGMPLSTDEPDIQPTNSLELADAWTQIIDRGEVAARLGTLALLDARAPERYRGEVEPIDPAAGHIPTAVSAPTTANLTDTGKFRSASEIRERLEGLAAGRRMVAYCGSGTTACHNILAARVAGLPDPILYVGSFSDWSRSAMPVATGAEPGEP